MRQTITFLLLSFLVFQLKAQVVETEGTMSAGVQSALEVELMGNYKDAEKIWKNYAKKYGKVDWDRKNKEHVLFDVIVPDVDAEFPVTVVSKFSEMGKDSKGVFWIKSNGDFINSSDHSDEMRGAGRWIQQFAYDVERNYRQKVIKEQEKVLKGFDKDLKKLVKQNENYHKDIEKAKKVIAESEAGIEQNILDQEAKAREIERQKIKIEELRAVLNSVGKS